MCTHFFSHGSKTWIVPRQFLDKGALSAWIRGFADGDGSVRLREEPLRRSYEIKLSSSNVASLTELREILKEEFGIDSSISTWVELKVRRGKVVKYRTYALNITGEDDILRYARFIGFRNPKQVEQLREVVKRYSMTREEWQQYKEELLEKRSKQKEK